MSNIKKQKRFRRSSATGIKIKKQQALRLMVNRTPKHTRVQIIRPDGDVVASASTLDKIFKAEHKGSTGNKEAAKLVGKHIAQRAIKAGVKIVAFDRRGYKYHGRVKTLAEAAREYGLEF